MKSFVTVLGVTLRCVPIRLLVTAPDMLQDGWFLSAATLFAFTVTPVPKIVIPDKLLDHAQLSIFRKAQPDDSAASVLRRIQEIPSESELPSFTANPRPDFFLFRPFLFGAGLVVLECRGKLHVPFVIESCLLFGGHPFLPVLGGHHYFVAHVLVSYFSAHTDNSSCATWQTTSSQTIVGTMDTSDSSVMLKLSASESPSVRHLISLHTP